MAKKPRGGLWGMEGRTTEVVGLWKRAVSVSGELPCWSGLGFLGIFPLRLAKDDPKELGMSAERRTQ